MRPGPIRPGDVEGQPSGEEILGASMRPGPIRPGDVAPPSRPGAHDHSFNEARADSPGRWADLLSFTDPETAASMRPGPIRPGDTCKPRLTCWNEHGFNEARADSPGRLRTSWRMSVRLISLQ